MDCSVLHMDSRQQMEQLDFRKRRVMMADAVCRLLEWVRMDNCRAILNMNVHEQRNTIKSAGSSHFMYFAIVCFTFRPY